jgi:hypothetical protein
LKQWIVLACIGLSLFLAGCGKRKAAAPQPAVPQETPQVAEAAAEPAPVTFAEAKVTSTGFDPLSMVNEALKSAIEFNGGPAAAPGSDAMDFAFKAAQAIRVGSAPAKSPAEAARLVKEAAFAEQILLLAKEFVTEFKVASVSGPDRTGVYTVSIEATIARQPAAAKN